VGESAGPRDRSGSSPSDPGVDGADHPEHAHGGAAPLRIFINYRREDAGGHALSLYEPLTERFGRDNVFMDIHAIEPGRPYPEVISRWVGSCDVLIALIGRQWATMADAKGRRRIDDPKDLVVLEIKAALDRQVRVIPATVQKAEPPTADVLPEALQELADYQAIELSDVRWAFDVGRLIQTLETLEREHLAEEAERLEAERLEAERAEAARAAERAEAERLEAERAEAERAEAERAEAERAEAERATDAPASERPAEGGWRIPRVGTEIGGYRIEALIGRGGMSDVFLAEHPGLPGRKVALKILSPELAEDEAFRERFVRESRLAAALEHPNIVPIYQAGEFEGSLFIVMRYVDGPDLSGLIESEGRLDPQRTLSILSQVAGALDAAHARELVHRDVKPGNVLIAPGKGTGGRDHAYLSDFGLVRGAESRAISVPGGPLIGTLAYIAPEQIEGRSVDHRADIYSLGCVLYECLTGQVPFRRDTQTALMWAHVNEPSPPVTAVLPNAPPAIDAVLARALAKSPDARYGSATELVADASAALAQGIGRATTQQTVPQELRPADTAAVPSPIPSTSAPPTPPMPSQTTPTPAPTPPGPTVPSPTAPGPTAPSPAPARGSRAKLQLIAGLVAAVVVGVVVVLLLGGGGGSEDLPVATIDSAPSGTVGETSATIAFGSDAEGATFECSLDDAAFSSCTSPQTMEVGSGEHTFRVRAVTDAGTGEPTSATWTVEGGGAGSDVTISSGPTGTVADATATFEFSSGDATATFECSLDVAEFTSCTSPQTYSGLTNGQHIFQVQAVSADGAAGAPVQQAWTVQVGADEFPNASEAALLQHIPGGIRSNCSRSEMEPPGGADAVIFCQANEEFVGVTYFHFETAADMEAYYDLTLNYAGVSRDAGGCDADTPTDGERAWTDDNLGTSGRVVCYLDEEQDLAALEWNEPSMLIHAWSFHTESDAQALLAWWGRFGGPTP
jgi:serine/threonine protein kinase